MLETVTEASYFLIIILWIISDWFMYVDTVQFLLKLYSSSDFQFQVCQINVLSKCFYYEIVFYCNNYSFKIWLIIWHNNKNWQIPNSSKYISFTKLTSLSKIGISEVKYKNKQTFEYSRDWPMELFLSSFCKFMTTKFFECLTWWPTEVLILAIHHSLSTNTQINECITKETWFM